MLPCLVVSYFNKRPLSATFVSLDKKIIKHWKLWEKGTGRKVSEVLRDEKNIKLLCDHCEELIIPNYKRFIEYFGKCESIVHDPYLRVLNSSVESHVKVISDNKDMLCGTWQKLRGSASEVYYELEKVGVDIGHKIVHPHYEMDVYSGRSKSQKFDVQGASEEYDIRHVHYRYDTFVNLDWIAADGRIGSIMSGDDMLMECYNSSDPYGFIKKRMNTSLSRDDIKRDFLLAINVLCDDHMVLSLFPKFAQWIKDRIDDIGSVGYSESILGRRFYPEEPGIKGLRRAFNAILQGSIAHCMNSAMVRVYEEFGDCLLVEQHDSLTLCIHSSIVPSSVDKLVSIMREPLKGILDFKMPVRVSIGKKWRKYHKIGEYR